MEFSREKGNQLMSTASDLLGIESTEHKPEKLNQVIDYIEEFFAGYPVHIARSSRDGKPSLVITTRQTMSPMILLQGHVDVVEGTPEQFIPLEKDGRLYARGAVDMKGFVAIAMHVLRDLSQADCPPDLGLMVTTDEEVGGEVGCGRLVKEGWSTSLLINGDGGHGDAVSFAEKGIVQLELTAKTAPGQRYAPWNGESAANILVRTLEEGLQKICPSQNTTTANQNWGSTYCILGLNSEENGPMPPSTAKASVRLYWTGEEQGNELVERLKSVFEPLDTEVEIAAERVYLSPEDPQLLGLRSILEKYFQRQFDIKADNGASDAKWFATLGVPIVILRFPGDGAHTSEEYLEVSAFAPLYLSLTDYIREQSLHMEQLTDSIHHQVVTHTNNGVSSL